MTSRFLAVTLAVTASLVVFAGAAQAAKPERGPATSPPSFDFPAGVVCSFPVHAEAVENRQTATIFSNGKTFITGFFLALVRNEAEPANELTLVASGHQQITPAGENILLQTHGPILFFFFPGDAGPGDQSVGRTYLISGNTEVLVDPETFTFVEFSYTGHARDICAELA